MTPLASIFGSGFLIIIPVLARSAGPYSLLAMASVCALAYAVGTVIRFNIRKAEPVLDGDPSEWTRSFERASDLALVLSYIVSVCLYLHILSAFVLSGFGVDSETVKDTLTTTIIVFITGFGIIRGLGGLERLEDWALYVTLGIIVLVLIGFGYYDVGAWKSGIQWPNLPDESAWQKITVVAGTLIVVQGFETPRYLADLFDTNTRIRASRYSQLISTWVYLLFIAAAMPILHTQTQFNDHSLIALVKVAVPVLAIPLIVAAALSQFSAAVADTLSGTGNMTEATRGHLGHKVGYIVYGVGAGALTWTATTFELTAFASRAFAVYYLLQCLVAISVSKTLGQRVFFGAIALALAFIAAFAVPAG